MKLQRPLVLFASLATTSWLAGCASTPTEPVAELAEAKTLIQEADSAGAGQFAPGPLAQARAELASAEELSDSGKDSRARQSAQRASADAKLALASTERAKAQKAATDSDAALVALRTETQRK